MPKPTPYLFSAASSRRPLAPFALSIALAAFLAGCTAGSSSSGGSTSTDLPVTDSNGTSTADGATSDNAAQKGVFGNTVRVGILHSLTGTMAISEISVKNAELLAIKEINEAGGILGKQIEPIIEDGNSDPPTFTQKAEKLLTQDKVAAIFGCWTSSSRKAVLPIVEKDDGLLYYPVQYEGRESSPNIFYLGATTNQQIVPAVSWLLSKGKSKMFLLGSDYIFPRSANKVIRAQLKSQGGTVVGEEYTPLGSKDYAGIIKQIKAARPDVVFSTLNGDSNVAFFKEIKKAGLNSATMPVMSVSVAEEEVKAIGVPNIVGQYAAWNYFETTQSFTNSLFVKSFTTEYPGSVTSDPVDAAYCAVYLWKATVEKANSFNVDAVRKAAPGVSFDGPGGTYKIDGDNQHIYKKVRIGKVMPNGMFQELWTTPDSVKPDPYLKGYSWGKMVE